MSNASAYRNPLGYEMVVSLEDLLSRITVASERKVSRYGETPDDAIGMMGLPRPGEATNEHLNQLQPLYVELLQNISSSTTSILDRLDDSEEQAVVLLYVIEYPLLVLSIRADRYGWSTCLVQEQFEMTDIARRILSNAKILQVSRALIADPGSTRNISVITSAVNMLNHLAGAVGNIHGILSDQKTRKMVRRHIFREEEDQEALRKLRDDLAEILSTRDDSLTSELVVYSVQVQLNVTRALYGERESAMWMFRAAKKNIFEKALLRFRDELGESIFQTNLMQLGSTPTNFDAILQTPYQNKDDTKPVYICANAGCNVETTQRCNGCKCVGYCSRKCQLEDWKAGHKRVCRKKNNKKKSEKTSTEAAKEAAQKLGNPALIRQNQLLEQNPHCDYFLVPPTGEMDIGVRFHPEQSVVFQMIRSNAAHDPRYIRSMYFALASTYSGQKELIRNQLLAEYGVDPEPDDGVQVSREENAMLQAFIQLWCEGLEPL